MALAKRHLVDGRFTRHGRARRRPQPVVGGGVPGGAVVRRALAAVLLVILSLRIEVDLGVVARAGARGARRRLVERPASEEKSSNAKQGAALANVQR